MTIDFTVTRRALTLGDTQDTVTGWYAKTFSNSTIEMIIRPKGTTLMILGMGFYSRHNLTGYTQDPVIEADEIMDAQNVYYEVKLPEEHYLGDNFFFRECELVKLPIHYDMPATYGTAPTVQDARQRTKVYLDDATKGLQVANLTKDDNSTPASYITCWADPPYPIIKVFEAKGIDLVFSIGTPNSTALPIGVGYDEHVPIQIFTIDKTTITGNKLRWKAEAELRRITETYPTGSLRSLERLTNNEKSLGSTTLYSVNYELRYKRYA